MRLSRPGQGSSPLPSHVIFLSATFISDRLPDQNPSECYSPPFPLPFIPHRIRKAGTRSIPFSCRLPSSAVFDVIHATRNAQATFRPGVLARRFVGRGFGGWRHHHSCPPARTTAHYLNRARLSTSKPTRRAPAKRKQSFPRSWCRASSSLSQNRRAVDCRCQIVIIFFRSWELR